MDPSQPPPLPPSDFSAPPPLGAPPIHSYPYSLPAPTQPWGLPYAPPPFVFQPRPRVWTVFVLFFLALVAGSIVAGIIGMAIALALEGPAVFDPNDPGNQDLLQAALLKPPVLLPMLAVTQVVLAAAALSSAYLSPTPLRRRLRLGRAVLPWYGYPVVAVGTLALGTTLGILVELLGLGDLGVLQDFEDVMTGMRGGVLVATTLVIGLAPGFGEELLFRGYIQTRLRQRWPRLLALLVTSLLFGLMHLDPVQSVVTVFLGMWLGEAADRTGSIWPAVVGHAFNNGAATLLSALAPTDAGDAANAYGLALAVSTTVFALCALYLLWRPVVPAEEDPLPPTLSPTWPAASPLYAPPPPGIPGAG